MTGNTVTLRDNIFCNDVNCLDIMNGIFYNVISNHFPIFSINDSYNCEMGMRGTVRYTTEYTLTALISATELITRH